MANKGVSQSCVVPVTELNSQEALALRLFSCGALGPFFCILELLLITRIVQGDQVVVGGCLLPVKGCMAFHIYNTVVFFVWLKTP